MLRDNRDWCNKQTKKCENQLCLYIQLVQKATVIHKKHALSGGGEC